MSKRPVVAAAVSIVLLALLGAGAVVVTQVDDRQEIVVDHAVVTEWEQTLAPGLGDLNSLDGLPGLRAAGPAQVNPCSIDSGELFDLEAGRAWTALVPGRSPEHVHPSVSPDTARGFRTIIRRLVTAGWIVNGRENLLGMELPTSIRFDTVDLHRNIEGARLRMSLQVFDDGVLAGMDYKGAPAACHLAT